MRDTEHDYIYAFLGIVRSTLRVLMLSLYEIGSCVSPTILELHNRSHTSKPNGNFTYHQVFNTKKFCFFTTECLHVLCINPLKPNDPYMGRIAPLTSKFCILYIYSIDIGTEYFKRGIYSPFFPLQNAVCFIILTYLVPVLFTFYIQDVLK